MEEEMRVELMRTLDEKFVADWPTFQTMRPTAGLVVDGAPYRRDDGTLDRDALMALARHLVARWPALRMRLRPMPLGVTTPAWVPAEPELAWHVRFVESVEEAEVADVLGGGASGLLALDRPLWTLVVAGLPDGDVAIMPQVSHALGDGIFALRFLENLTADAPFDPAETPPPAALASAGCAFRILLGAFREWRGRQDGLGGAWREYWRKSFVRRLRRTGGRILRPRRLRRQQDSPLPRRRHAARTIELRAVKAAARAAGCSLHDLVVAASLVAASGAGDGGGPTSLLVPISRRLGTTGDERNNISMTQVEVPGGASKGDTVAAVTAQLGAFIRGEAEAPPLSAPGYTSYLPWRVRPRYAGPALVRHVVLWPVLDPRHTYSVFASSYASTLTIAVSGDPDVDVEAFASEIVRVLLEEPDAVPEQSDELASEGAAR